MVFLRNSFTLFSSKGGPRLFCPEVVQRDMKSLKLLEEMAADRVT